MRRLLLSAALCALASAAHADLFVANSTFTVEATGAPNTGNDTAFLPAIGGPSLVENLPNSGLTLSTTALASVSQPGDEWLIFQYSTTDGGLISPTGGDWQILEAGLDANQQVKLENGGVQFDVNGVNAALNSSPFGNLAPVASPPSDLTAVISGPGLFSPVPADSVIGGPGGLPGLGTFLNPFSQLSFAGGVTSDEITSYTEALEFAPVAGSVPEPSTWALMLIGFSSVAVGAAFRRRGLRLA